MTELRVKESTENIPHRKRFDAVTATFLTGIFMIVGYVFVLGLDKILKNMVSTEMLVVLWSLFTVGAAFLVFDSKNKPKH